LDTRALPTVPPAPGRFSTTTCWPIRSDSFCARMRPNVSELPPGACGTISLIGRDGKAVV
jgi:hypothetical protein